MPKSPNQQVLDLVREQGIVRPRDLRDRRISRQHLKTLLDKGLLQRPARGLYISADADLTEEHSVAEACKRVPGGVICLLSALRLHGLTTQIPHEVWMAIEGRSWHSKVDYPPLRIVRFTGKAFQEGIQRRKIEGVEVRAYDPAKTVADCFKYRNKIGIDVAMEALRDCWKKRLATMDELWAAAGICRVAKIMRPYLESLT